MSGKSEPAALTRRALGFLARKVSILAQKKNHLPCFR